MEVNRDYNIGDPPHQEDGGSSQDDSTLGVITIEKVDRGNQENDELEMEVLIQADDSSIEKVNTDYSSGDPQQLCQEGGGSITIDDSFMEDANRDYDSHSNTQDDSIDRFLNDTITITDDPTVDDSQEEHEVIYLTTSPADSQVSSVLPSLNETVEEEICPVCHETFENIEKDGILRVKLVLSPEK